MRSVSKYITVNDISSESEICIASSLSLNSSQKQTLANWRLIALHPSWSQVWKDSGGKRVIVTFNLSQLCCLLVFVFRQAQNSMSKQISSVKRQELTFTSVSLLHSEPSQNWEHTQHCLIHAGWIRESSSLTCICPAMSLPWWLRWQVWNNTMQRRHGTQQWRDSHPSGRSLRNRVSGQLKGNKKNHIR